MSKRAAWALASMSIVGGLAVAVSDDGAAVRATTIEVKDFMFSPATVTVSAGATVSWINRDDQIHTVASNSGLFRSAALDTGQIFYFRFDKSGTYRFNCSLHPRMVGTVIVRAPSATG